jgi:hypothetical protein
VSSISRAHEDKGKPTTQRAIDNQQRDPQSESWTRSCSYGGRLVMVLLTLFLYLNLIDITKIDFKDLKYFY